MTDEKETNKSPPEEKTTQNGYSDDNGSESKNIVEGIETGIIEEGDSKDSTNGKKKSY